jgi:hypothetical protein
MPPAIDLGSLGPALYGGVRGARDARRDSMEEEAFNTDQAIRRERLANEQTEAPLRRRSLELGLDEQQRQAIRRPKVEADQDILRQMGIDTAKLTLEEKTALTAQAKDARQKEERLKLGLGQFHTEGDPQAVADAMGDMYPDPSGEKPKAVRNADGSITLSGPRMKQPIVLKAQEIGGAMRSADDQLAMYAYKLANPVNHLKERLSTDLSVEKEGAKQQAITDRAVERERERGEQRVRDTEAKGKLNAGRAVERGVRLGKTFVDSSLKTASVPGHFQATYSSEDDAKLLPHIYKRMGELVRNEDKEPEEAASTAVNEVRTKFLTSKKTVMDAVERLRKAGVDPKDKDSLAKRAPAGNRMSTSSSRAWAASRSSTA